MSNATTTLRSAPLVAHLRWVAWAISAAVLAAALLATLSAAPVQRTHGLAPAAYLTTSDPVLAVGGDISCDAGSAVTASTCRQAATSDVVLGMGADAVLPLGDTQYESGSATGFQQAYAPSWGRARAMSHPVVGNHEYETSGARGYYDYFGAAAGDPAKGYYSWDIGSWHLIALNSECSQGPQIGCASGSPQEQWLRADLAAHPRTCTLAYWHQPRFSSGNGGSNSLYQPFWQDLYAAHADVVLNGHSHAYERFAPQTPTGSADAANGLRQFVIGTGGVGMLGFTAALPNEQVRQNTAFGVLKLVLHATSYDWRFMPVAGSTWTDAGSGTCHAASAAPSPTPSPSPTSAASGIVNGGFESGSLSGWTSSGAASGVNGVARTGTSSALVGSSSPTNGLSSIAQGFTAPAGSSSLSFWWQGTCPDTVQYDWATASLQDSTAGTTATILPNTCASTSAWRQVTAPLTAGHRYTLTLSSRDDNYAGDATYTRYDDVTVTAGPAPSVSPSPSPAPSGSPSAAPAASGIVNGGFESGSLSGWTSSGAASGVNGVARTGTSSALVGSSSPTNGLSSIAQGFTAPAGSSSLSFWWQGTCPDTVQYDWATASLQDSTAGTTATILPNTCASTSAWRQVTAPLTAGHRYTLTLSSRDDNYAGDATYTRYDDVTVS